MDRRIKLNEELVKILGSNNVYFQPPESIRLNYPCIVYSRTTIDNRYADDDVYNQVFEYKVIVIDRNPDSEIVKKLSKFKYCRHNNHYVADNLNHDAFTIKY